MSDRLDEPAGVGDEAGVETESAFAATVLPEPGRSPLLVAFVASVFLVFGYDAGMAGPVAGTVVAALGVVAGCLFLGPSAARARVLGSTIVASSLVGFSIAVTVLPSGLVVGSETALIELGSPRRIGTLLAIAGGIGGLGFAVLVDRGGWDVLYEALRDGAVGALLVAPLLVVLIDGTFHRSLLAAGRILTDAWTQRPAIALLSLQVLAISTLATAALARLPFDQFTPWRLPVPSLSDIADRLRSISGIGYWLGIGYAAVWFVPGVLPAIDAAITSLGPIGIAVAAFLRSGIVHGLLLAASALFLGVGVGFGCSPAVRRWLEPTPARTLSAAAGGFVVPAIVLVGGTAGTDHGLVGLGAIASLPLVLAFVVAGVTRATVGRIGVSRRRVLGIATASLFAAAMGLAVGGLSTIGVLIAVAAVILAWDLGANALSMRRSVGPDVDATESIATHATAVVGVLVGGVVLGGLAVVAATVGGRAIALRGATAAIVLLVLGAVLAVATIALDQLSEGRDLVAAFRSARRWALSNQLRIGIGGVLGALVLGWLVHPQLTVVGVVTVIVLLGILVGGLTDDRPVSPRQRF